MADVSLQSLLDATRHALDAGDADRAVGIAQHITRYAPDVIEGQRLLGEAFLNAQQPEQAISVWEHVLRTDPENVAAYSGIGLAQQMLNRPGEAIRAFEHALEIQPNLNEVRNQLLRLYAETPNSNGQFRLSRPGLGRLYARGQMYPQAIDEFRAVLETDPSRDDVRAALAEVYWRAGEEDEAIDWCREALRHSPDLFKPTLILGYLRLAAGEPDGEPLWRRAAQQEPALQTARNLFETLPPIELQEPRLPAWDEQAWRDQQESQRASVAIAAPTFTVPAEVDDAQLLSDDELLARLLGIDQAISASPQSVNPSLTNAPSAALGAGLEDDPDRITQTLTFNELGLEAQPFSFETRPNAVSDTPWGRVEPFSIDWNGATDDETEVTTPVFVDATRTRGRARSYDVSSDVVSVPSAGLATQPAPDIALAAGQVADPRIADAAARKPSDGSEHDEQEYPYTLADLGLSEEQRAEWDQAMAMPPEAPGVSAPTPRGSIDTLEDTTPFTLADLGLTDDQFQPLGENGSVAAAAASAPPSTGTVSIHEAETQPFEVITAPSTSPGSATLTEQGAELPEFPEPESAEAPLAPQLPTEFEQFIARLDSDPENHGLRLAIARMSEQQGDTERALEHYKQLIRRNALVDSVTEDLQEMTTAEYPYPMQRRIHRLLGDALTKQDRFEEAMAAYSWV